VEISGTCENPDAVKQAVCEEITLRKEKFFTREEFDRTKKAVYANFLFGFDSTEKIATDFLSFIFADNDMLDYPIAISNVTYEDAKEVLNSSFDINKCVLSIIFPKNN
jgi:predicted Zn-dependent peptidase